MDSGTFLGALACRFCSAPLTERLADLGQSPLSNDYKSEHASGSRDLPADGS